MKVEYSLERPKVHSYICMHSGLGFWWYRFHGNFSVQILVNLRTSWYPLLIRSDIIISWHSWLLHEIHQSTKSSGSWWEKIHVIASACNEFNPVSRKSCQHILNPNLAWLVKKTDTLWGGECMVEALTGCHQRVQCKARRSIPAMSRQETGTATINL